VTEPEQTTTQFIHAPTQGPAPAPALEPDVDDDGPPTVDTPPEPGSEPIVRERYVPRPLPYAPPPPRRFDPARWLRTLAGVDENLVRQVWFERARHTALGGLILGTGLIAGFSMWMAINESLGYASWVFVVPALIWLIFIVSLDRALVSTMVGQGRRWGGFLMRLALSVMFGLIIAEPLTIRIFQTAIEQHIRDERVAQLDHLRSDLLACNSKEIVTGQVPAPATCRNLLLSFDKTTVALATQLAQRQADEKALQTTVDADNKELARLTELAAMECAGTKVPGTTGDKGYGPNCRDRRQDADNFRAAHNIKGNIDKLGAIRNEIATLTAQVSQTQASFEATRAKLIADRVEQERSHQGNIGLLERMNALHELAATSLALFLGTWAVRLFFVLADCLPVVVKFSGGSSEYDRIVRAQAGSSVESHERDLGIMRDEADSHVRKHRADLDVEVQEHRADVSLRRARAVSRVASDLMNPRR
jgi:hypothetical protein